LLLIVFYVQKKLGLVIRKSITNWQPSKCLLPAIPGYWCPLSPNTATFTPPPLSPPSHIHNALPVPHWRCHLPLNRDMSVHSETWPPQGSERKLTKSHDAPRPNGGIATFNPPSRHMAASTVLLLEDLSRPFPKDRRGGGGLDNAPAKRASWAVQPHPGGDRVSEAEGAHPTQAGSTRNNTFSLANAFRIDT
jgi:hypothetical protein